MEPRLKSARKLSDRSDRAALRTAILVGLSSLKELQGG